jgi:hypothetical protein
MNTMVAWQVLLSISSSMKALDTVPGQVQMVLQAIVQILIVPFALISIIAFAWRVSNTSDPDPEMNTSRKLAFLLGVVLTIILIVLDIFTDAFKRSTLVPINAYNNPWPYIVIGFLIGAVYMAAMHLLLNVKAMSLFIVILTTTSLSALYFYAFASQVRSPILIATLCWLAGILTYAVVVPKSVSTLLGSGFSWPWQR